MAIKIDGQDLLKKFIGWQEIVRIYKNGGEIRPNTVPPVQPTYHIISDFTQWSLPSDYTITSWSAVYTSNGISVDTSGWSSMLSINTNTSSGFPSLKNATKIKIEIKFYWDVINNYAIQIILNSNDWVTISKDDARFDSSTPWVYSFSRELDLQTYTTKLTMTTPLGVTTYTTWESYDQFVWNTRESTWLTFRLFPWVALSDVDVYIWESSIVYVNSISSIGVITTSPWATVTQTLLYSPGSANSSANLGIVTDDIDWIVEDAYTRLINGSIVLTISTKNRTGTESLSVVDQRSSTILRHFTVFSS